MPHAVTEESPGKDLNDDETIRRFLQGDNNLGGLENEDAFDRDFDQTGKDANAVDYEDISDDDDLPEEEEATNHISDGHETTALGQPIQGGQVGFGNGRPSITLDTTADEDLLGNDDVNDLFGEKLSSPIDEHTSTGSTGWQNGLTLPSKNGLALPSLSASPQPPSLQPGSRSSPDIGSPSFLSDDERHRFPAKSAHAESEDDDLNESDDDEAVRAQRALFRAAKRRGAGLAAHDDDAEVDLAQFYAFFPNYEKDQNPRFIEFFPPRPVQYRGKVPLKPPRPVQATKVTLELLPDQERSFRSLGNNSANANPDGSRSNLVHISQGKSGEEDSDDDLAYSNFDETELVGGMTMQDLAFVCEDWDILEDDDTSMTDEQLSTHEYESRRPQKRPKLDILDMDLTHHTGERMLSFENPEAAAGRVARQVTLDLNDTRLLIDEHALPTKRKAVNFSSSSKNDSSQKQNLLKRYNISNDEAYDLLKENHQHKIRSTLGSMAVEHSLPATKLQYPFYRVTLEPKAKRNFHRPSLHMIDHRRDYRFQRLKTVKRKERRGKDVKELFATSESLAHNDNANMLLLEYSEEAPTMLSNFGMGNRLINYYRKRGPDDQERPKRETGETQVLLTQDKSPFSNFGHVDQGEIVPTIQNAMYRAPIFQHTSKPQDFLISISTTHSSGSRLYLRNLENLHTVGQQFPLLEVPGEHSRKVTDAAKKRLRALSYRIYTKSQDPSRRDKQLDNATVMLHLKNHDMPQTRSKMREFMDYERLPNRDGGVWVPKAGSTVPDADTLRGWVKPEDVCLLDSMQVGVQRLNDLGLSTGKEVDEEKDDGTGNIESQLAPWRTTKNFLNATQGKAMLKLHGEGDPTGRGEGFSFVRTSMKGGFQALGESAEDKIDAKKRREAGGHSYNVAKQQKAYDDYIRMIWERQKQSLNNDAEMSDGDFDDEPETDVDTPYPYGRAATPRSAMGTPAAFSRRDDESASQFSRGSAGRPGNVLVIKRISRDYAGQPQTRLEQVTDPKIISLYKKRRMEKRVQDLHTDLMDIEPTGDPDLDAYKKQVLEKELARVYRNIDRRHAREKAKGRVDGSPGAAGAAGSPGASEIDGPASTIDGGAAAPSAKGRGRNKDATARKCANCGQVGHIKTNRKLCPMLNGTMRPEDINPNGDSSFGAVPAPLKL